MSKYFIDGLSQLELRLSEVQIKEELEFLDALLRWNQRINLTSITNRNEAIEKHLLDSLLLLPHLVGVTRILDMGSGGGFPGIPLAIAAPGIQVLSIDSIGKKINFQKHIKRMLKLKNLTVMQSRIEEIKITRLEEEKYDLVVSRAFSTLDIFIKYAAPWLKSGGRLIAMKGPEGGGELSRVEKLKNEHHLVAFPVLSCLLPYSHAERQLIILKKQTDSSV